MTDLMDDAVTILPIPYGMGPFPSSFEVSGVDLDIGIGYDLVR